jgi:hypothetical protein
MGGIAELWAVEHSAVKSVTVSAEDVITNIALESAAKFTRYYFRRGAGSMTPNGTIDPANGVNFITTDVVVQFAKMDTAKRIAMNTLTVAELALIVKDNNGKYWYLGYDNPVTASASSGATGQAFTDANMYSVTLQDMSLKMPYEVGAEAVAELLKE